MIKSTSDTEVAPQNVSPVSGNSKHQTTPLRFKRKTSRKDQSTDVHTCSTPIRMQSGNQCSTFNSPDSFMCSQENRPDVVWDYTSPKLPMGSKKKEIKITVDEFLKSLSHNQAPECNTQNSNYIKLLEKWMAKQNTPVCVKKPTRTVKRDYKMRSRRVFEEIKQFMQSIQEEKKNEAKETAKKESTNDNKMPKNENLNHSDTASNKISILEDGGNKNDSIDELWGEADNSFIVKATQHLDVSHSVHDKNVDIFSTIPETNMSNEPGNLNHAGAQSVGNNNLNKAVFDSDQQAQILLTQIMSCDWDSDSGNEDLENGFIMGDEDFSLIPDEVLCGADNKLNKSVETLQPQPDGKICDKLQGNEIQDIVNKSPEITFGCSESNRAAFQADNMSEIELFNNFDDDDSFGDESILCKPEVLSWIDEVEKLSQSQKCTPEKFRKKDETVQRCSNDASNDKWSQSERCTPEEIERKKDEALERRKRNQSKSKRSS